MNSTLSIVQAILAVLLIIEVLLQQRGSGMGMAFGGSGEVYGVRRGAEKFIFIATVVTAVLFFVVGIVRILIEANI
ncbi:preprotein translocase subunit SecG [Candidatus Uhrbacteria bacterium RIFCSPLOWO2_02_FULL_49_11]|uniref:Protein-export membrane protein SecG n=1 Tax=Candidatus Uhrbacteria bacterium RIFCSPLOWO2_02_FULL_49_11 TaxID=1802409 RepID=A0A1F7VAN5_9BACT|nr:MAG: preprotein translocase subunit SecG [Candidatus Uhrbacteria bacterium RIFCSPLOWO2_02_FULL_49_11]